MNKFLIVAISLLAVCLVSFYSILNFHKQTPPKSVAQPQSSLSAEQAYYPLVKGNRWEYEVSKREQQGEGSVSASKRKEIVEVTGVRQDSLGEVFTLERRNNIVGGTGKEPTNTDSWLVQGRTVYDFTSGKVSEAMTIYPFPLYVGQRWGEDEQSLRYREDGFYNWKVEAKFPLKVLGNDYPECFRLVYNTASDTSYKILCYGVGLVEEGYKHMGTLLEWTNSLVNLRLVQDSK